MVRLNIDKDRLRTRQFDRRNRGYRRVRSRDHLVARADSASPQGHVQGLRSAAHSDSTGHANESREFGLKSLYLVCQVGRLWITAEDHEMT